MGETDYKSFLKGVGNRLKLKRKAMGIRQVDLAERAGITYRHYQEIEAGRVDCRITTLLKVAQHLEFELSELLAPPSEEN